MAQGYSGFLWQEALKREIERKDRIFSPEDDIVFQEMLEEINASGYDIHYLATFDFYNIPNIGEIVKKYIFRFQSENIRSALIEQLVFSRVPDCGEILLELYLHYRQSTCKTPTNAGIIVRYDNAFNRCKPKRIKNELLELLSVPINAYYLPFTLKMLSSWKIPECQEILLRYLHPENISASDLEIAEDTEDLLARLQYRQKQLRCSAILNLRYYPTDEIISILENITHETDRDFCRAAEKSLQYIKSRHRTGDG